MIGILAATAFCAGVALPVPSEFVHDRVFVTPVALNGAVVRFFTDTGGGWNAIAADLVETLELDVIDSGRPLVAFPEFATSIPPPPGYFFDGRLMVVDRKEIGHDGALGGRWHADRIWAIDYHRGTLCVLDRTQLPDSEVDRVPLGFQVNDAGERTMHFPRLTMTVAGRSHEMLLDTGATATLAADAAEHFGLPAGERIGTSFIAAAVFEEWRTANPDWMVIPGGDSLRGVTFPMIEVPVVTIGRHTVGPVWFARRPDNTFREWMSGMMDQPIDGALGGSAFRYFRLVIDYPGAGAYLIRPES